MMQRLKDRLADRWRRAWIEGTASHLNKITRDASAEYRRILAHEGRTTADGYADKKQRQIEKLTRDLSQVKARAPRIPEVSP